MNSWILLGARLGFIFEQSVYTVTETPFAQSLRTIAIGPESPAGYRKPPPFVTAYL
jgi:hypothetical protein